MAVVSLRHTTNHFNHISHLCTFSHNVGAPPYLCVSFSFLPHISLKINQQVTSKLQKLHLAQMKLNSVHSGC